MTGKKCGNYLFQNTKSKAFTTEDTEGHRGIPLFGVNQFLWFSSDFPLCPLW